ncbi:hypothetical protein FRC05_001413 [Tulasnella sp. 425]|nr:hypothetical protein FRC05_001413 [Tulasnella sp. 425]
MIEEPGSVNDFDISGSYFGMESQLALPSPSVADLSLVGAGDLPRPLFQSDTFPRSSKDSTSASIIFKQSLRMSMADSEADRMTLWRRLAPTSRAGTLKCRFRLFVFLRFLLVSSKSRLLNWTKRRATVGGPSAPEFVMAQEGRLSSTVDDIASLNRSVSMRVPGHISPVANLEQEILRAQSPAPQRLSAVIDPADFSVEFMRSKDRATSTEPKAPTPLLPAVTISQRAPNYSPPPSPITSLSDQRRKSRTSILLMDRLGVPSTMNLAASTSSVNFGTSTEGTPPQRSTQSFPKDYDRLLMSTSGVSRLGKGYQSDRCGKRKSVPSTPQSRTVPSTPSSKFNRKTLFGTRAMGTNKSAEPTTNRSNSSTFKFATGKLVKSFDDLGGKKATPTLACARLKGPQNTPSPKTTTEKPIVSPVGLQVGQQAPEPNQSLLESDHGPQRAAPGTQRPRGRAPETKGSLFRRAIAAKLANLHATGATGHALWDKMVSKKISFMGCDVLEGYGLIEARAFGTRAGSYDDATPTGTIGGAAAFEEFSLWMFLSLGIQPNATGEA